MSSLNYLQFNFFRILVCLIALYSGVLHSQENETVRDSTSTTYSLGEMSLPDPNSIVTKYEYDPITNRYIYREMLGDFNVRYPLFLTPKEFEALVAEEQRRAYFKEKIEAFSGKKEGSEEKRKNLLPIFYVNSNFFSSVFGGSEIEIIPQGSVEMDLGLLYTKQDNPAFSPRNRSNFTFDFDQRISLSLLGKIGTRLQITANYDTEATFDFQEQLKLEYTPTEDDIIQSIEVGNVSMPLNSSLIQGAQSLFGVKMGLQFGRTTITGVYSEQRSETRSVNVEGGGTIEDFELFALDYDENRHFFLAHYFRDTYSKSLANYPFINNNIQITRLEVWVTNRATSAQTLTNARNIVALQDLGESAVVGNFTIPSNLFNPGGGSFPDNGNNDLDPVAIGRAGSPITDAVRQISTVQQGFTGPIASFNEGFDYAILENARKLNTSEYTLNTQLGYISLNQRLNNDEVLAVAFQYTVGGRVFQVGEFANDGVDATVGDDTGTDNVQAGSSQSLVVKMLKSPIVNVTLPIWDLMMKNIYSTGAFRLEQNDFRLNILYSNPSPVNYITAAEGSSVPLPDDVEQTTLLKVFNLDRLNPNNDPVQGGDGFFDYVPGVTIDSENGRIIFTTIEPFGEHLFDKLDNGPVGANYTNPETYNPNQAAYVFRDLYTQTKVIAEQRSADKNYFQLKGRYKSSGQDGIALGAFNVPQGSVNVTAGGRILQEGVDYSVNYQLGRVTILDEALLASNTPIEVSTENNAVFGQQTKRFTGLNIEHKFSDDFIIGGTFLNLNERPVTQKSNYDFEPINNTILGLNAAYSTEVPFLTRMVNKLPNIDTDVPSNISVRTEGAYLIAGAPRGADFDGKVTTYIDDFEGAQTRIDVSSPLSWELSSVPIGFGNPTNPNAGNVVDGIESGYKRAKLSWYSIDPIFYSNGRPSGVSEEDLATNATRRVFIDEVFPETDIAQGQTTALFTLDLNYDPNTRGQYNFNPAYAPGNSLPQPDPRDNFAGITRQITSTNFEQANVEFIEFWLMDPFATDDVDNPGGTIVFNLGNISEDVLKDGRKQYENGLPANNVDDGVVNTDYARVPVNQSLIYAFDSEGQARTAQDAGFDGLSDQGEQQKYSEFSALDDPSGDNYTYFLQAGGGVLERYRNYNGTQGNSPTEVTNDDRGNTTFPTAEDVNRDNTMNTIDSYFEYEIPVFRGMGVGNDGGTGYISDIREINVTVSGRQIPTRWVRFKVPIYEPTTARNISDFRSIRFMRMYLTDFSQPTLLRFANMDLVRGDYRRYIVEGNQATDPTSGLNVFGNSEVIVTSVSAEETPNYTTPPGVVREQLNNNNNILREDERSLALTVNNMRSGDARGVYKNFSVDMRQYENLEMFLHLETVPNQIEVEDGDLKAFIRMGNDFTNNFYQIELPLTVSERNVKNPSPNQVWPEENRLNLPLELLQQVKSGVLGNENLSPTDLNFIDGPNNLRVGIKGNPNFGDIRVLMVGIKNDSGSEQSGTVWFNEMRLSDLKNQGGWAAVGNLDANIADFANVSASGRISTIGFGSIEQGPNERSREDLRQYDLTTNVNLGQLLPKKWGIQIPFNYSRGEELITPQFDPEFQDIELQDRLDNETDAAEKKRIEIQSTDYTKRQSFNVIGLRKERTGDAKPMPYDVENLTFSGTYNQTNHRDFEIEGSLDQNVRVGATYDFSFQPKEVEPFKKIKLLGKSKYFDLFKDFNFNLLPTSISVSSNINRQYNEQSFRDITLGPDDIRSPTLFQRNFLFDWQYGVNYNLTKSLNLNFTSSNNRIVKNFIDENNVVDNTIDVWSGFFEIGDPNTLNQQLQVNYEIPFKKIPVFKFMRATYSYNADFQWVKGSEALKTLEGIPDLGNTIQNANVHTINGSLDMNTLYKYVGLTKKKPGRKNVKREKKSKGKEGKEGKGKDGVTSVSENKTTPKNATKTRRGKLSVGDKVFNTVVGLATAVKKVNINYQQDNGIFLPGYTREPGFVGTLKPTVGFTFGSQAEIRDIAARNGWLTLYDDFNEQYQEVEGRQLNIQASLGLLKDLKIDISATRNYSETYTENYRVNSDLEYQSLTPNTFGNFTVSTLLIKTAFSTSDEFNSEAFDEFRENRLIVARRLAIERGDNPNNTDEEGFPVGYGKTNQAVLLPAFLAAYSGSDASKVQKGAFRDIPLPNWDLKYTGLMNLKWFKKRFKRFSVAHGYRANYTINQFQTNLEFEGSEFDEGGNYRNPILYSNINLTEQFSPLVRLDMEMKSSIKILAEWKKDRALSLSFDNNLLTEIQGNEYIIGLGYRLQDLTFATRISGRKQIIKSDLNLRADLSLRQNETLIRYLDLENSQVTAGQDIYGLKLTADYALSKNLTALFFYDHTFSEYSISTAFPQTTIRGGFTLRYNFGN